MKKYIFETATHTNCIWNSSRNGSQPVVITIVLLILTTVVFFVILTFKYSSTRTPRISTLLHRVNYNRKKQKRRFWQFALVWLKILVFGLARCLILNVYIFSKSTNRYGVLHFDPILHSIWSFIRRFSLF